MPQNSSRNSLIVAIFLIAIGVLFLAGQIFNFNIWSFAWPLIIIVVGLTFFAGMIAGGKSAGGLAIPGSIVTMIGLILLYQNTFHHWATWSYAWTLIIVAVGIGLIIFGYWSSQESVRQSGMRVIGVGFVLFVVFGSFFELGAMIVGLRSPSGLLWPILLILAGIYLILSRTGILPWSRSITTPMSDSTASSTTGGETASPTSVSGDFSRLIFKGAGDITITQGDHDEVKIEANDEVRARIKTEIANGTLTILFDADWGNWIAMPFAAHGPIRFYITMKNIDELNLSGAGNLTAGQIVSSRLNLVHGGAGNMRIDALTANDMFVEHHGLGNIDLAGKASALDVVMSGAGNFSGGDLECQTAIVKAKGLGNCRVWVKETLNASLSGAGNIEYFGTPVVTQNVSGLGKISSLGNK
jgi:hypothetical protein